LVIAGNSPYGSPEAEKAQEEQDNDDESNKVDQFVHVNLDGIDTAMSSMSAERH